LIVFLFVVFFVTYYSFVRTDVAVVRRTGTGPVRPTSAVRTTTSYRRTGTVTGTGPDPDRLTRSGLRGLPGYRLPGFPGNRLTRGNRVKPGVPGVTRFPGFYGLGFTGYPGLPGVPRGGTPGVNGVTGGKTGGVPRGG